MELTLSGMSELHTVVLEQKASAHSKPATVGTPLHCKSVLVLSAEVRIATILSIGFLFSSYLSLFHLSSRKAGFW